MMILSLNKLLLLQKSLRIGPSFFGLGGVGATHLKTFFMPFNFLKEPTKGDLLC